MEYTGAICPYSSWQKYDFMPWNIPRRPVLMVAAVSNVSMPLPAASQPTSSTCSSLMKS